NYYILLAISINPTNETLSWIDEGILALRKLIIPSQNLPLLGPSSPIQLDTIQQRISSESSIPKDKTLSKLPIISLTNTDQGRIATNKTLAQLQISTDDGGSSLSEFAQKPVRVIPDTVKQLPYQLLQYSTNVLLNENSFKQKQSLSQPEYRFSIDLKSRSVQKGKMAFS
ncbi:unnamed protein product, partial [Didymodactylos carnosus]